MEKTCSSQEKHPSFTPEQIEGFVRTVWRAGEDHHRDLPWRYIDDPYAVLVSEIMLQQTQVVRVEKYWPRFMDTFPTLDALAAAEVPLVLEMWQGLGYNRRALALKRTAEQCAQRYDGQLPEEPETLLALPGIGPATAGGVIAFAFQRPTLYLETNVRTVFLHELFPGQEGVSDKQIEPLVIETCSEEDPRGWYYALLDYGAYLKSVLPNPSRRSKHHTKQSAFEGSKRQKRAELVRIVLAESDITVTDAKRALDSFEAGKGRGALRDEFFDTLVSELAAEGFFQLDPATRTLRA